MAEDRVAFGAANPLKIKQWLRSGELDTECIDDMDDIWVQANRALDKSCSHDIVGECVFMGDNGKWYVGRVEFEIVEADLDYVKELSDEDGCNSSDAD